jgi:hypothetical protein
MPAQSRRAIIEVFSLYVIYVLLAVVPIIIDSTIEPGISTGKFVLSCIFLIHFFLIQPVLVIFGLPIAALAQVSARPQPGSSSSSLSMTGLVSQAAMFAMQAIVWPWETRTRGSGRGFPAWWINVGWLSVHDAVYAVVQLAVWVVAAKQRATVEDLRVATETEPLLSSQATAGERLVDSR